MAAATLSALTKKYGSTTALHRVDLTIEHGEVTGLLGPNGAGKTTLLRALLGLVTPDTGSVEVLGVPRPVDGPLDGVAGFVEAPQSWPYLTGRRTLELLAVLDGGDAGDRVENALEQVGLTSRAGTRVGGWSTGMRQRLGLAAALLRRPRLLVLDEPTSGLDPAGVAEVHDVLRRLAAEGAAVLISSHDMAEVAALCASVTVLAKGRVRYSGPLEELRPVERGAVFLLNTPDNATALDIARRTPGVRVDPVPGGLEVLAEEPAVDALVLALATHGLPVRSLMTTTPPAVRAFLELTA